MADIERRSFFISSSAAFELHRSKYALHNVSFVVIGLMVVVLVARIAKYESRSFVVISSCEIPESFARIFIMNAIDFLSILFVSLFFSYVVGIIRYVFVRSVFLNVNNSYRRFYIEYLLNFFMWSVGKFESYAPYLLVC